MDKVRIGLILEIFLNFFFANRAPIVTTYLCAVVWALAILINRTNNRYSLTHRRGYDALVGSNDQKYDDDN